MAKHNGTVGSLHLPMHIAFRISMQNVRIRFWRTVITAAGTVLGIAFLVSVLTAMMIQTNSGHATDQSEKVRMIWLVAMSLIVCFVGITNAMQMSVTERYKEIGTMKCLGAYDSFIVRLFFIEAALSGVIASTIGWVLGLLAIIIVRLFSDGFKVFVLINWGQALLMLLMALALGTILSITATILPARVAAKMPAAAALRVEI